MFEKQERKMHEGNVTFVLGICRNCRVLLNKRIQKVPKDDSHDDHYETDIDSTGERLAHVSCT